MHSLALPFAFSALDRRPVSNLVVFGLVIALFAFAPDAMAAAGSGGDLPYEDWLTKIKNSITGPYAFVAALLGLVGAGSALIFGGSDMNGFLKTILYVVMVLAFLVAAQNMLAAITGRGAEIAAVLPLICGSVV